MAETDIRKVRSRQLLVDALLRLMETEHVERITISQLTGSAHLARSTFYAQFSSMDQFITTIVDDLFAEFRDATSTKEWWTYRYDGDRSRYFVRYFTFVAQHAKFFRAMLGPNGPHSFQEKMVESAVTVYENVFKYVPKQRMPAEKQIVIQYIASANVGITVQWLNDGMRYSAEYMAQMLTAITFRGLLKGLQIDDLVILPR